MKLLSSQDVHQYLFDRGLVNETPVVEPLSGGVSCSVFRIIAGNKLWVIKQALEKLTVKEDWFSDVARIHREHEVMESISPFMPEGSVPKVIFTDYKNHVYIMTSASLDAHTWKEALMGGNFSESHAEQAGFLLSKFHYGSVQLPEATRSQFNDQHYFHQLRIEPFHRHVISKHPELRDAIENLITELTAIKRCLVHGDFSPKNMLIEKSKIVLIDFEVAHWGNPIFDLAYCIGHLMLKGWHLNKPKDAVRLIQTFLRAYETRPENLMPHLGLMLLARIDGKSPVNYITNEFMKNKIRTVASKWIVGDYASSEPLSIIESAYSDS
jgi:5-methylthioribose kinase